MWSEKSIKKGLKTFEKISKNILKWRPQTGLHNWITSYKKDLARLLRSRPPATGGAISKQFDPNIRDWQGKVSELKNKIRKLEVENDK